LKRKDNTFYFETEEGKKYLPIEDIKEIYIFGEVTVSKKFLEYMSQKEILIHFFNYYGYYVGTYYPREHLNSGYMILRQAEHYLDNKKRIILAKKFIEGSAKNILNVIRYYKNRGKNLEETERQIKELMDSINSYNNTESLMAIEGNIRDIYYQL